MKKSLSILTLLLVGITFSYAIDVPTAQMSVMKNGSTVKLFYKGVEQTNVKVLIRNDINQVVYVEKIKNTEAFIRPYNFSALPEGNYRIQLIDNNGMQMKEVNYTTEKKGSSQKVMHLLRMDRPGADKFVLSVPNIGSDLISITIYNDSNQVLYDVQESIAGDFAKIYNFGDYRGPITFVVSDSKGRSNFVTMDAW